MVDLEEPTLTLKDASGLGEAPSKTQAGDSAAGKVGSTTFAFSDPSGNVALAPMSANGVKTDGSAVTQPVSAASLPLPTGAATSANQVTANASLASIDAGIPAALGQTTKSASMPIAIASDQEYPYSGANNGSNPSQSVSLGADDSTNIKRIQGRITDPLTTDFGVVIRQIPRWPQTFSAHADNVTIGNGKSMLSLFNAVGSGVVIRIHEIKIFNVQTTAVTGVIAEFGLRKITTHSAGTQLTTTGAATGMIYPRDSNNSLNANVTARTGATVTESPAFDIENWFWSSDEWGAGSADVESMDHAFAQSIASFKSSDGVQPYVLRPGQGMHVRQATNSVNGSFDIMFVFTQETA